MKEIKSYVLILKNGDDKIIRGISAEGGKTLESVLTGNPPMFIKVKGRIIARAEISQLVPVY